VSAVRCTVCTRRCPDPAPKQVATEYAAITRRTERERSAQHADARRLRERALSLWSCYAAVGPTLSFVHDGPVAVGFEASAATATFGSAWAVGSPGGAAMETAYVRRVGAAPRLTDSAVGLGRRQLIAEARRRRLCRPGNRLVTINSKASRVHHRALPPALLRGHGSE
jgi:hypothetical protein